MIQEECLEESTKNDIINSIDSNIKCVRLESSKLSRDLSEGRQTTKNMRSNIRELNTYICRMEILKKDIDNISICK